MSDALSAAQFTHTEFGSARFSYRSPKQPYKSEVRITTHTHRGVTGHQWQPKAEHGKKVSK